MKKIPFIKTNRVILRQVTEDDLLLLMAWWNDGEVMKHVGYPGGLKLTPRDMEDCWKRWQDDPATIRMIVCLKDGTPVGETAFHDYHPDIKETEIGLKICIRELWEQGLGTEVLKAMTDYAFCHLGVERILLNPSKTNARIIHVNEKCGYHTIGEKNEGILMELRRDD